MQYNFFIFLVTANILVLYYYYSHNHRADDTHLKKRREAQRVLKNAPHHGWEVKKILKYTSSKTALEG